MTHLFSHASNHLPLILHSRTDRGNIVKGSQGFKFKESWLLWEDCETVIRESWAKYEEAILELGNIKLKITGCGEEPNAWRASKTHLDTNEIKRL